MSCLKLGKPCAANTDCMPPDNENASGCLNLLCNNNNPNVCASTTCTSDSQCSQFGGNYTCVNGNCVNYGCTSATSCPSGMKCGSNGLCTSITCENGGCPKGAQCKTLSDGSKVCLNDPGLPLGLLLFSILLLVFVTCVIYLILTSSYIKKRSTNA